ncbi:MAG: S1 RNA-binding domain-containing protein [Candidatus Jordarchaeaceae archaeon]
MEIYNGSKYISGKITKRLNNGYEVDIGISAFLPFNQIKRIENFNEVKDKTLMFKIIKLDKQKRKVILSRTQYITETTNRKQEEIFSTVKEGDVLEGVIKNITDFGVFVDLGGVEALVPKKELSYKRIINPSEMFQVNQKIKVSVLSVDREKKKIILSYKNLLPDPWKTIDQNYQIGMITKGKVIDIKDYGVFVELEEGIDGFLSRDDLSWAKHTKKPSEIVSVGSIVEVKILEIDKLNKKIKLGLKQIKENPLEKIESKYQVGQKLNVIVKRIIGTGAYVEIENEKEVEGFIPVHEISWTKKYVVKFVLSSRFGM